MKQVVADRYRLDAELGSGGMAEVSLAWDIVLDRDCAVKLLRPVEGPGAAGRRQRMRAEAEAMAALDHAHIVRVYEHGVHEGRDFIAMEYVSGGSLEDRLAEEGPLPPAAAVSLIRQVLDALSAAHEAGVVHRDVKPANVLLRSPTEVALCDFGIARSAARGGTETGVALGSVGYMAPEQRIDARRVGPAADLYAVACTLFNLVTGDTPVDLYLAPDHSPRWADVPAPLVPVLRKATQADPEDRYVSAAEMGSALGAVESALEGVAPVRRRRSVTQGEYLQTTDAPASDPLTLEAGARPRSVRAEDWQERGGRPPGRMALWVGTGMIATLTLVGLGSRPLLADLESRLSPPAPAPEPVAEVASGPERVGRWLGNVEGNRRAELWLEGSPEVLVGELELGLGTHRRASRVHGSWTADGSALALRELDSGAQVRLAPGGVPGLLVGELAMPGGDTLPMVLVWVGRDRP